MHRVKYTHWKKEHVIYEIQGTIIHNKVNSDRIVVLCEDNHYEDIIKSTIIEIKEIKND